MKSATWRTNNYRIPARGGAYLVETKNRVIYMTAQAVGGNQHWARHRVDMGGELGKTHVHDIACR